jgi:hypothetical protein
MQFLQLASLEGGGWVSGSGNTATSLLSRHCICNRNIPFSHGSRPVQNCGLRQSMHQTILYLKARIYLSPRRSLILSSGTLPCIAPCRALR